MNAAYVFSAAAFFCGAVVGSNSPHPALFLALEIVFAALYIIAPDERVTR